MLGVKLNYVSKKSCTTYLFILLFSLSSRCKLDTLVNCRLWTINNPFPVKHTFNWPMLTPPPALGFWLTGMCWWSYSCSVTHSEIGIGCHNHRSFIRNTYRKKTYVILVNFIMILKKYQCTIMYLTVGKVNIGGIFLCIYCNALVWQPISVGHIVTLLQPPLSVATLLLHSSSGRLIDQRMYWQPDCTCGAEPRIHIFWHNHILVG